MSYTQKRLIELLKEGAVPGESSKPKHVETVISNVFVFPNVVYKLYKNDSDFFNASFRDISSSQARFEFTKNDFNWNHALSPRVYQELRGVYVKDDQITFVTSDEEIEEYLIAMTPVNEADFLFERLSAGTLSSEDGYSMGKQLAERLKKVRPTLLSGYDYYALSSARIQDVRNWIKNVSDLISSEEQETLLSYLESFLLNHTGLFQRFSNELANAGDVHSFNGAFIEGELNLMDTYPPKSDWQTEYHMTPVYRLGADLWALGSKEIYDAYIRGYKENSDLPVIDEVEPYYIVYASLIMVSYLYMLQRTAPQHKPRAVRYHKFLRNYHSQLTKQLVGSIV